MRKNEKNKLTLSALQIKNIYSQTELNSELLKPLFFNRCFDKNRIKLLVSWSLKNCGQKITIDLIENLKNLGFRYATEAGISLGIDDLRIPSTKNILIATAEKNIKKTNINSKQEYLTGIEKFQHLIDTWHKTSEILKQDVIANFQLTDIFNPVYMMAFSGARGNVSQVRQLVGMRGLMSDPQGQILDFPIKSNFREGITLTEYIISCYGARKGLVDTALKTANSGYLTRRLVDVCHHIIVCDFDCKTKRGVFISDIFENRKIIVTLQNRLVGRILAEDIYTDVDSSVPIKTSSVPSLKFTISNSPENLKLPTSIKKKKFFFTSLNTENKDLGFFHLRNDIQIKLSLFFFFVANNNSGKQITNKSEILPTSIQIDPQLKYVVLNSHHIVNQKQFCLFLDTILLYKPKFIAKKNQEISVYLAKKIARLKKSVFVRSPLTCEIKNSICQLCYGWSLAHGKLVSLGEAVGVVAAQSIGEPGTQLTMRTFHTGGVFSGDVMNEIVAPFSGKIIFDDFFPGMLIRTPHGKIAFLTKAPGSFNLVRSSTTENWNDLRSKATRDVFNDPNQPSTKKNTVFQIPGLCVLFVRNQEYVTKGQSLAEFSLMAADANQRIQASHDLNAEIEGEILFKSLLLLTLKNGKTKKIISRTTCRLGCIWILSGKICMQSVPVTLFSQPGDLVDTNSIIAQSEIMSCYSGFISKHEVPTGKNTRFIGPLAQPYNPPYSFSSISSTTKTYIKKDAQNGLMESSASKDKNLRETQPYLKQQALLETKFFLESKGLQKQSLTGFNHKIASSKSKKNWLKYPLLSYSVELFQYKKIGYFFLFSLVNTKKIVPVLYEVLSNSKKTKNSLKSSFGNINSVPNITDDFSFSYIQPDQKTKNLQLNSHKCFLSNSRNHEFKNSRYLNKNFFFKVFPQQYETETGGQLIYDNFYLKKKAGEIFWIAEETYIFSVPTTVSKNFINYLTKTSSNKQIFLCEKNLKQAKQIKSSENQPRQVLKISGQKKYKYQFLKSFKPKTKKFISDTRYTNFYYNSQGKFSVFSSKLLGYTQSCVVSNSIRNKIKLQTPQRLFPAKFSNLNNLAFKWEPLLGPSKIDKKNLKNTLVQQVKTILPALKGKYFIPASKFYDTHLKPNPPQFYGSDTINFMRCIKLNKSKTTKNEVPRKLFQFSANPIFMTLPMFKTKVCINKKPTPQGKLWSFRLNYRPVFNRITAEAYGIPSIISLKQQNNQRLKKNLLFLPGQEQTFYRFFPLQSKFGIQLNLELKKIKFTEQTKSLKNFIYSQAAPKKLQNPFFFFHSCKKNLKFLQTPLAGGPPDRKKLCFFQGPNDPRKNFRWKKRNINLDLNFMHTIKQKNSFSVPKHLISRIKFSRANNASHKINKNFQNSKIYSFHYKFSQIQFNVNPLSKFFNRLWTLNEPHFFTTFKTQKKSERFFKDKIPTQIVKILSSAKNRNDFLTSSYKRNKILQQSDQFLIPIYIRNKKLWTENSCLEKSLQFSNVKKSRIINIKLLTKQRLTFLQPHFPWKVFIEKSKKRNINFESYFFFNEKEKKVLSGLYLNSLKNSFYKSKEPINVLGTKKNKIVSSYDKMNSKCIQNRLKFIKISNTKQNLIQQGPPDLGPKDPRKNRKVEVSAFKKKSIKINIKPGWIYFPPLGQTIKSDNLDLNIGSRLTKILNVEIRKKHEKIIKAGTTCFDTILFDQYPVYCQCISINRISVLNNKYLRKKSIDLQKQVQFKNLVKQFQYTKQPLSNFSRDNTLAQISQISKNLQNNKSSRSDISKNKLNLEKYNKAIRSTFYAKHKTRSKFRYSRSHSVFMGLRSASIGCIFSSARNSNYLCFEVYALKKWFFHLFSLKLRSSLLFKTHLDISQLYYTKKTYKNKFHLVIKRVLLKTITTENLLTENLEKIYFLKNPNFTIFKCYGSHLEKFSPTQKWSLLPTNTNVSFSTGSASLSKKQNFIRKDPKNLSLKSATSETAKIHEILGSPFNSKEPSPALADLRFSGEVISNTEKEIIRKPSRFLVHKLRTIIKHIHFPRKYMCLPVKNEIYLGNQKEARSTNLQAKFVKNKKLFLRCTQTRIDIKNQNSFQNELWNRKKSEKPLTKNWLDNKNTSNFFDFSYSLKIGFIQSHKLPKFYAIHRIKTNPSLILFADSTNFLLTAEPQVHGTLATVAVLDSATLSKPKTKSYLQYNLGVSKRKNIHYSSKRQNKKTVLFKNLAVLISKVKSYSFQTVTQYKKGLAQQNKISTGNDTFIFSQKKIKKTSTGNSSLHSVLKLRSINKQNTTHLFRYYPSPDFYLKLFFKFPFYPLTLGENESNGLTKNIYCKKTSLLQYNIIFIIPKNYKDITTKIHFGAQTKQRVFKNENIEIHPNLQSHVFDSKFYTEHKTKTHKFDKTQKKIYSNILTSFNVSMFVELETLNSADGSNYKKATTLKAKAPKLEKPQEFLLKTSCTPKRLLYPKKNFTKIFSSSQNYISLETPVNYTNLLSRYYGEILYSGLYLNKDNLNLQQAEYAQSMARQTRQGLETFKSKEKNKKSLNRPYARFSLDKTEKQNYLILTSDEQITFEVDNSASIFKTPFYNKDSDRGQDYSDMQNNLSSIEAVGRSKTQNLKQKKLGFNQDQDLNKYSNLKKEDIAKQDSGKRDLRKQQNINSRYTLGDPISYGAKLSENLVIPVSGVIIQIQKSKITVRKAQALSFSAKGLISVYQGDIIEKNTLIMRLFYQRLKTGDIVQGIPKIEQLFEARKTNQGELLSGSLHEQLEKIFLYYIDTYNFSKAARYSLEKIQQIIVSSVQKVYRSQGVIIADKHLEIIIRQMTSKVEVIESGHTSLLPGEIVDLDWIEVVNKGMNDENTKAKYVPIILGITRKSLETKSFISEASFQETTRVLTKSSIERRTDFLKGLKENVILGHLVPAGTGFYSNTALHKRMFPSIKTPYYETDIYESYNIFRKIFSPLLSDPKTFFKKKTN
jgi:hypothetical protein|uniref:DNA-directed RNA polymerase subunit beta'' n=1 Tax=Prasiola crispa TaxID=173492 RepID=A0A0R8RT93_PRACR|nr:beta'' subunit of RNA polymerase [Prasiola crispa]